MQPDKQTEAEKLLSWCEQSISKNREKWITRTTGPHWSELRRYVKLYDLVLEMQAEREIIIDSAAEEIAHLKAKNDDLLSALVSMVRQYLYYPNSVDEYGAQLYSHDFMSAGEEAVDLLVRLGVMQSAVGKNLFVFIADIRDAGKEEE